MSRARAHAFIQARSDFNGPVPLLLLQHQWETAIEAMVKQQSAWISDEQIMAFTLSASVEEAEFPQPSWNATHTAALLLAGGAILIGMRWLAPGATQARRGPQSLHL